MKNQDELRLSGVNIVYNISFDLGKRLNAVDAARILLRQDFGLLFKNPLSGETELANAYAPVVHHYRDLSDMWTTYQEFRAEPTRANYLRFLRKAPLSLKIGSALAFAKQAMHPTSETIDQLADDGPIIQGVLQDLAEQISKQEPWLAVHDHVDRSIFVDSYLMMNPFVRVALPMFSAAIPECHLDFEVTLTVHRMGVAILSAYAGFPSDLTAEEIIRLKKPSILIPEECEVPETVFFRYLELSSKQPPARSGAQREQLAAQLRSVEHPDYVQLRFDAGFKVSLANILEMYMYHVVSLISGQTSGPFEKLAHAQRGYGWHGFPIVFIRKTNPAASSIDGLKGTYGHELARLIADFDVRSSPRSAVVKSLLDNDLSKTDAYTLFMTEGSATVLYFEPSSTAGAIDGTALSPEWLSQYFQTSVVLDMLLLQREIITALHIQLSNQSHVLAELNEIKKEYLLALDEIDALSLTKYGDVSRFLKRGQEILRINDRREAFLNTLQVIEGLITVAESQQRSRREKFSRRLTAIVAVVFALPAASSVVNVVQQWSPIPPNYLPELLQHLYRAITDLAISHPTISTVTLYLVSVVVTLSTAWFGGMGFRERRRPVVQHDPIPKTRSSVVSPVRVTVLGSDENNIE